jgi:RNA polymerase sigma-70 factor, ECF subfamily
MHDSSAPKLLTDEAFAELLKRFQWPLYVFLRGFISDPEQSRDLVQDVFCDAWRAVQRTAAPFDGRSDEEALRRWLFNVAYRRAVSVLRRRRLIRWESLDVLTDEPANGMPLPIPPFEDTVLDATVLRATFAALTPENVALLLLTIVHGFTSAEVADIIGISHEATKKRLTRAKQQLRAEYLARNPLTQEAPHP